MHCLLLCALLPVLVLGAPPRGHVLDMSHALVDSPKMPIYPGLTKYKFTIDVRGPVKEFGNANIEMNTFKVAEHTATHIDAPAHVGGRLRIHQLPAEDLIGPAAVIDIRERAKKEKEAELSVDDILKYEEKYGRIPDKAFVLCLTGWEEYWSDPKAYLGTDNLDDHKTVRYPGIGLEAAKWLVENRDILGVGTDGMSIEKGSAALNGLPVHRYLCGEKNLVGLEQVANLSRLPPAGATIFAVPVKIHDGSGAPTRIFAIINGGLGIAPSIGVTSVLSAIAIFMLRH